MVRLKHRYLLINILYPDPPTSTSLAPSPILSIHRPTPDSLTPALLSKLIREAVSELFGDWGVGKLGGATAGRVGVKYLSPATSTAIVRCPRDNYRLVCAALAFLNAIPISKDASLASMIMSADMGARDRVPCVFQVVRVSGTIKKVEQEAIRRARRDVARLMAAGDAGSGMGAMGQSDVLDRILGTATTAKAGGDVAGDVVMGVDDDEEDGEGESDDE